MLATTMEGVDGGSQRWICTVASGAMDHQKVCIQQPRRFALHWNSFNLAPTLPHHLFDIQIAEAKMLIVSAMLSGPE